MTDAPKLEPVAIAIQSLTVLKREQGFKATGIDLDSGRTVAFRLTTKTSSPQRLTAPLCVLTLNLEP